jgi:hypothetical protein
MGALMDAQREDEQNKLEDCDCKFGRLHQTLPGFGKLRLAWWIPTKRFAAGDRSDQEAFFS